MDRETFLHCIPSWLPAKPSAETVDVWHGIFEYIVEHGQTDYNDHRLYRFLRDRLGIHASAKFLTRHFKRMHDAGLLAVHTIVVRPDELYRLLGVCSMFNNGPAPGKFKCYTLPGKSVDLEKAGQPNFEPTPTPTTRRPQSPESEPQSHDYFASQVEELRRSMFGE